MAESGIRLDTAPIADPPDAAFWQHPANRGPDIALPRSRRGLHMQSEAPVNEAVAINELPNHRQRD